MSDRVASGARSDADVLTRMLARERQARAEAEALLESKARDLAAAHERLRRTSLRDHLTGLGNRAALEHALLESEVPAPFAVVTIDLLRFRRINDAFGRGSGDRVLHEIGVRLSHHASEYESGSTPRRSVAARLGGDQFALLVIAPDIAESIEESIADLITLVEQPIDIDGNSLILEVNAGFALGDPGADLEDILDQAALALDETRAHNSRRVSRYSPATGDTRRRVVDLEQAIRSGLDRGEFTTHFQPRIDSSTGEITASEALIRWFREDGSVIPAGDFIGVAEQSALVDELGAIVLRDALALLTSAESQGTPHLVSVNLSNRQWWDPRLAETLAQEVNAAGVSPSLLEIELKESIAADDLRHAQRAMSALRSAGFSIAMDDFGTGHSSLGRLRELPIDVVKIDRSFVSPIPDDPRGAPLLEAVIGLARAIGVSVVVEGVETAEQFAVVSDAGHCQVQGFRYAPAVPAADLLAMLREQPWRGAVS